MKITTNPAKHHWNYFLALEKDMDTLSRYIEICDANFKVFSVELAHLLLASASEVDVVAKLLCEQIRDQAPRRDINNYKALLVPAIPTLSEAEVFVPRYGLSLKPWGSWAGQDHPIWWRSYNNVKHQRDAHFCEANLENGLNALGALLVLTFYYYSRKLAHSPIQTLNPKDATRELYPESKLLRLHDDFYYSSVIA